MRILGKGKTAQAIFEKFPNAKLFDDNDFENFDTQSDDITVVSPGIPPHNKMVQNAKNLISEYDLFASSMPFSIWISGTNGKTTTTEMLDFLLSSHGAQTGGNIGNPLANLDPKASMWILETSSFTLHYTNIAYPNLYILLPISEDHIYWHGSYEAYIDAKLKPLSMMKEGDIAIIPQKFESAKTDAYKICYENSEDLARVFEFDLESVKFLEPFKMDALLALAVYRILFDKNMTEKLNVYKVDVHKIEKFSDKFSRVWIDDSKATNVDAVIWALKNFENKKIYIILGGDDKGADLTPLFEELIKYDIEIFAIGKNQNRLQEFAGKFNLPIDLCDILENAVNKIHKVHSNNSIAMLSPAAASLDQFSGYKHRGQMFKKFVENL